MFNYNRHEINKFSKEQVKNLFRDGDNINVYDINNIIGA
jgi:hypothetical protein